MENPELYIEAPFFLRAKHPHRRDHLLPPICLRTGFYKRRDQPQPGRHPEKYQDDNFAIELVNISNGYQFLTKKNFHSIISLLQLQRSKKKLSPAALETLAIIAYKQNVTKLEIEQIRGVNSEYSIQKLLEKELITILGKSDTVGKANFVRSEPTIYGLFRYK